ncbi:MAG: hypothetical protein A2096_13720 [Spirochaetes bacterium GWF1_41_5]|nr:MAG: hypothetical protein A2096_13720 [Spirochaetes bacterium GWF1_41_5]
MAVREIFRRLVSIRSAGRPLLDSDQLDIVVALWQIAAVSVSKTGAFLGSGYDFFSWVCVFSPQKMLDNMGHTLFFSHRANLFLCR